MPGICLSQRPGILVPRMRHLGNQISTDRASSLPRRTPFPFAPRLAKTPGTPAQAQGSPRQPTPMLQFFAIRRKFFRRLQVAKRFSLDNAERRVTIFSTYSSVRNAGVGSVSSIAVWGRDYGRRAGNAGAGQFPSLGLISFATIARMSVPMEATQS